MSNRSARKLKSQKGIFIVLVLGVLVLALFFLLWIHPLMAAISTLDGRIAELELRDEKQKRLMPIYQELMKRKPVDIPPTLNLPEKAALSEGDIAAIIPRFKELSVRSGLGMLSADPRLKSLETTPGRLSVDVVITGNFFSLREFLFLLARLPYLETIETISVRQTGAGAGDKQMTLKVWLAVS